MFKYEREMIKRALLVVARGMRAMLTAVARAGRFVSAQIQDPAVRRALILGCAAYCVRRLPFLDQSAAEGLSDKALLVAGLVLSKLPGTAELAAVKQAASPAVITAAVPPPPPARVAIDEPSASGVTI